MDIEITGIVGRTRTIPERAVVALGETVRWIVRAGGIGAKSIEWQVYFRQGSPFKEHSWKMKTEGKSENDDAAHAGVIDAGETQQPGEYKYGVRAVDTSTNQELSDDDPFLIVQSR